MLAYKFESEGLKVRYGAGDSVHRLLMQGIPASKVFKMSGPIKIDTPDVVVRLLERENLISL